MPQTIFCPGCGEGVSAGVASCPACGTVLPQMAPEPSPPERDAAGGAADSRSPHGWMESPAPPRPVTPLPSALPPPYQPPTVQQPSYTCPGCGRMIPPGNVVFCPQCGRNLQATQDFQPHQNVPRQFATPPATPGSPGRGVNDQLLIILLAVIAACVILGFFC